MRGSVFLALRNICVQCTRSIIGTKCRRIRHCLTSPVALCYGLVHLWVLPRRNGANEECPYRGVPNQSSSTSSYKKVTYTIFQPCPLCTLCKCRLKQAYDPIVQKEAKLRCDSRPAVERPVGQRMARSRQYEYPERAQCFSDEPRQAFLFSEIQKGRRVGSERGDM
jgi:hypothetical protein